MKYCAKCGNQYSDPTLNFCLDDGSVLLSQQFPDEQTILINQTRDTEPRPAPPVTQPTGQPAWNVNANAGQPKKKSSKMWIVVLLIFGGIVFLCFGGFAGLVFISNQKTSESTDQTPTPKPTPSTSGKDDSPPSDRKAETKLDISEWGRKSTEFGKTEFVDGELLMSANRKGYFYVLIAKQGDGRTNKANTSVIVRNIDSEPTNVGYGLVIHSSPTPLDKDYSFLIDTVKQRYRIAYHIAKKESILVDWTRSDAVKSGAAENVLEARDLDNKIEFYINGTMVTSIRNVHGHPNGVPGIYSGDGLKIGFKDLTLRR